MGLLGPDSEEKKNMYWKSIERSRIPYYAKYQKIGNKMFMGEAEAVIRAVEVADTNVVSSAMLALEKYRQEWAKYYAALYLDVGGDFAMRTINDFKSFTPENRKTRDTWQRVVSDYLKNNAGIRIRHISDTSLKYIREQLEAGVNEGESIDKLARRISDTYQLFTPYRSRLIARTEVIGASNLGSRAGAIETGLNLDHIWLSTRDNRTRDDHVAMDGQRRPLNEPFVFPDGSRAMFPGDGSMGAPPSEIIQCRCTEYYEKAG